MGSVVGAWWLSTGLVLLLQARARSLLRVGLTSSVALTGAAALVWSSAQDTSLGAYVGFGAALAVWGWHELAFLTGVLTGPRKAPCPPHLRGVERFRAATATLIHHEIALAATGLLLVALTWDAPNQAGPATFGVLWLMRISAKLNLFVGVPHANTALVPAHMRYLITYFGPARLSAWLPLSLCAVTGLAALVVPAVGSTPGASTLVGTLLALGALEHVFLARPFGESALWRWAQPAGRTVPADGDPPGCAARAQTL